jgi:hypothetical protein
VAELLGAAATIIRAELSALPAEVLTGTRPAVSGARRKWLVT